MYISAGVSNLLSQAIPALAQAGSAVAVSAINKSGQVQQNANTGFAGIDLGQFVKMPSIPVAGDSKTLDTIKYLGIGLIGIIAIGFGTSMFSGKSRRRSSRY